MFGLCCLCMCVSDPLEPFAVILGNMSSPCFNMHFLTFKTVFVWSLWPVVNKLACLPPQLQYFPILHHLRVLNSVLKRLEKDPWGSKHELCLSQTHGQHASRQMSHNVTKQSAMPLSWVAWHEEWYTTCSPFIWKHSRARGISDFTFLQMLRLGKWPSLVPCNCALSEGTSFINLKTSLAAGLKSLNWMFYE